MPFTWWAGVTLETRAQPKACCDPHVASHPPGPCRFLGASGLVRGQDVNSGRSLLGSARPMASNNLEQPGDLPVSSAAFLLWLMKLQHRNLNRAGSKKHPSVIPALILFAGWLSDLNVCGNEGNHWERVQEFPNQR